MALRAQNWHARLPAPANCPRDHFTQRHFQHPKLFRQTEIQVQKPAVNAADFDGESAVLGFCFGRAKCSHAAYHYVDPRRVRLTLYGWHERISHSPHVYALTAWSDCVDFNSLSHTARRRPQGRAVDQLRPLRIQTGFTRYAEGSVVIAMGDTQVLCTASVLDKVPPFLKGQGRGWVTAEYGMLPRSTHTRSDREAARGKQSGRTQEIQRLIGRSLRAVFDLEALGERTLHLDCDVLQADGGTRCASITGAWVAASSL